eukprot:3723134-Amphidinium_carterae.1
MMHTPGGRHLLAEFACAAWRRSTTGSIPLGGDNSWRSGPGHPGDRIMDTPFQPDFDEELEKQWE